jgi:hypothetical protein
MPDMPKPHMPDMPNVYGSGRQTTGGATRAADGAHDQPLPGGSCHRPPQASQLRTQADEIREQQPVQCQAVPMQVPEEARRRVLLGEGARQPPGRLRRFTRPLFGEPRAKMLEALTSEAPARYENDWTKAATLRRRSLPGPTGLTHGSRASSSRRCRVASRNFVSGCLTKDVTPRLTDEALNDVSSPLFLDDKVDPSAGFVFLCIGLLFVVVAVAIDNLIVWHRLFEKGARVSEAPLPRDRGD